MKMPEIEVELNYLMRDFVVICKNYPNEEDLMANIKLFEEKLSKLRNRIVKQDEILLERFAFSPQSKSNKISFAR